MSDPHTVPVAANGSRPQFGLGAIFGTIFALGLYFAFLRRIDATAVLYGCLAILMGLAMGGTAGLAVGQLVDAVCAPIVGVLIGVLIEILQFVEADRRLPRYTIATWLLCAVLAGNQAVARFVR